MSAQSLTITSILALGNLILSSANVIIAFSLLVYISTYNFRSPVARGFLALLTFVTIVYVGDVIAANVVTESAALIWLRFQWLGIAFVPAAYLHFSDAVLSNTGSVSRLRNLVIPIAYGVSLIFCLLAAFTDIVVQDGVYSELIAQLRPGPSFGVFVVYFGLTTLWGMRNIQNARQRCLTSTSRRRMTYLGLASVAPAVGVFPYLLIATTSALLSPTWIYVVSLLGNIGIAFMTVVMGYAVAYHGVLTPDRVIKHSMMHYLLRGPVVGIVIIALMLVIPRVERILGLPRDTVLIFTVTMGIVLLQVTINVAKPYIDRLIYRKDREELAWIQTLDQRLFTTTDLEQLLENLLTTVCDFLRVRTGFVVAMEDHALHIRVFCGSRERAEHFLSECDLGEVIALFAERRKSLGKRQGLDNDSFVPHNGYWLLPLNTKDGKETLGIMGIEARSRKFYLNPKELETVSQLVSQAERALEDTRLQQEVFSTLQRLVPEIEELQRLRGTPHYARPGRLGRLEASPVESPNLEQLVKEALNDYWGGPRLSRSPLLRLKLVEQALEGNDGVPSKTLRFVLLQAIERLRPAGERKYTATEWLIYNILEMRFLKGIKARDVAQRLAISESDFYRKQRVAIAEMSKTLADMEREANRVNERVSGNEPGQSTQT